ncbi:MAG TPA: hypothetical protein VK945_02880 [Planococcus sp. (in: firmicutes)]|nr:hypothetical protein [Planococcus sp. (in: firmicutes)]
MDFLLLSAGLGVESFNVPVIAAMGAAPILLILGIVWIVRSMKKQSQQ